MPGVTQERITTLTYSRQEKLAPPTLCGESTTAHLWAPCTFWASTSPREAQLLLAQLSSHHACLYLCLGTIVMDLKLSALPGMPALCLREAPASARAGLAKAAGVGRPWMDGRVCTCVCVNKLESEWASSDVQDSKLKKMSNKYPAIQNRP